MTQQPEDRGLCDPSTQSRHLRHRTIETMVTLLSCYHADREKADNEVLTEHRASNTE